MSVMFIGVRRPSLEQPTLYLIDEEPGSRQFRSKPGRISKHYPMHTKLDSHFDVFAGVVNVNGPTRLDSKSIQENLKNTPVWLQHLDQSRKQHAVKPAQAFEAIDSDRERLRRPVAECIYRYTPGPQFSQNIDCARDLSPKHFPVSLEPSIDQLCLVWMKSLKRLATLSKRSPCILLRVPRRCANGSEEVFHLRFIAIEQFAVEIAGVPIDYHTPKIKNRDTVFCHFKYILFFLPESS